MPRPVRWVVVVALGAGLVSPALASRLKATASTASSAYPADEGGTYEAKQGADGKLGTSWVEGEDGSGLGSWYEIDFGEPRQIQRLKIWGGMWYSYDYWTRANRPKDVEIKFDDGSIEAVTLKDEMKVSEVSFPKDHVSKTVRIKIKSVHNGSTWFDTPISEVQAFDSASDPWLPVSGYKVSSQLPEDADGNYEPTNLGDGFGDSMWCEGNKAGDGSREWIEVNFTGPQQVGSLTMIDGIGSSLGIWMKGNRATAATLTFSDGTSEAVTLKNTFQSQQVSFTPRSTSKVRVTFDTIIAGKEYNDLCISELYFQP